MMTPTHASVRGPKLQLVWTLVLGASLRGGAARGGPPTAHVYPPVPRFLPHFLPQFHLPTQKRLSGGRIIADGGCRHTRLCLPPCMRTRVCARVWEEERARERKSERGGGGGGGTSRRHAYLDPMTPHHHHHHHPPRSLRAPGMQDPAGNLQLADGTYHVFPCCRWEHFSSTDLVHWTSHGANGGLGGGTG